MRASAVVLVAVTALGACGRSKPLTGSSGGAGSGSAAGAGAGTGGGAGTTGAAGTGGGAGTTGAAGTTDGGETDASARCHRTNDTATVVFHASTGQTFSCATASPDGGGLPEPFVDKVVSIDPAHGGISFASGGRLEITAPGLDLTGVPQGPWIKVKLQITRFFGCAQMLELTTAAPPDGTPATYPVDALIIAVVDGGGAFPDSSYTVDRVRLNCSNEKGCGSPAPDEYAFDFKPKNGEPTARVTMGEVAMWHNGVQTYMARNLRSFQSTACDDYWNFAYTIVPFLMETIP